MPVFFKIYYKHAIRVSDNTLCECVAQEAHKGARIQSQNCHKSMRVCAPFHVQWSLPLFTSDSIPSSLSLCVCDLFVYVYRATLQNTAESTWINRRLPVILFSCKSVKFPSMWKFYFAVDKNMRARRLIKKEARVCHRRHYILFPALVPAAAQIACVILRAASQYISANWLFIYFVRGCARAESVVFSQHTPDAQSRENMNNNSVTQLHCWRWLTLHCAAERCQADGRMFSHHTHINTPCFYRFLLATCMQLYFRHRRTLWRESAAPADGVCVATHTISIIWVVCISQVINFIGQIKLDLGAAI